jgi:riboflavin kinase
MSERTVPAVGNDELTALKFVALDGGLVGPTKVSCSGLAGRLDASTQTASRRLQRLEEAGLLERDVVSDGQWVAVTEAGVSALRREYADYRRLFESESTITLTGTVTDGMGEGRHYISLSGYMEQFRERLGYEPYPGTLNLTLTPEAVRARSGLSALEPVPIDGWADEERTFGPASCYPATVAFEAGDDEPGPTSYEGAHIIVPERTHHDEDELEVIAPDRLRDVLSLSDGDRLAVTVHEAAEGPEAPEEATATAPRPTGTGTEAGAGAGGDR